MLRRALGRLGAVPTALLGALVVTGGSAVALAAASGPAHPTSRQGAAAFGAPRSAAGESSEAKRPDADESGAHSDEPKAGAETPSPSLTGLCHAVQAGATSNPGKAIENPAFSVLVHAAGGRAEVAAYCTELIGAAKMHGSGKPADVRGHGSSGRHAEPRHTLPPQAHGHR